MKTYNEVPFSLWKWSRRRQIGSVERASPATDEPKHLGPVDTELDAVVDKAVVDKEADPPRDETSEDAAKRIAATRPNRQRDTAGPFAHCSLYHKRYRRGRDALGQGGLGGGIYRRSSSADEPVIAHDGPNCCRIQRPAVARVSLVS